MLLLEVENLEIVISVLKTCFFPFCIYHFEFMIMTTSVGSVVFLVGYSNVLFHFLREKWPTMFLFVWIVTFHDVGSGIGTQTGYKLHLITYVYCLVLLIYCCGTYL